MIGTNDDAGRARFADRLLAGFIELKPWLAQASLDLESRNLSGPALARAFLEYVGLHLEPWRLFVGSHMFRGLRLFMEPEDVLQGAFMCAWESADTFMAGGLAQVFVWFLRIVFRTMRKNLTQLKALKRRTPGGMVLPLETLYTLDTDGAPSRLAAEPESRAPGPLEVMFARERFEQVVVAILTLEEISARLTLR